MRREYEVIRPCWIGGSAYDSGARVRLTHREARYPLLARQIRIPEPPVPPKPLPRRRRGSRRNAQ